MFILENIFFLDSEGLALAKSNQLSTTIDAEKKRLEEAKITLKQKEKKYDNEYEHFNEVCWLL